MAHLASVISGFVGSLTPFLHPASCATSSYVHANLAWSTTYGIGPSLNTISARRARCVLPSSPGTFRRSNLSPQWTLTDRPQTPRVIADLSFVPNTLAALPLPESEATLIAAGGLEADVHLSLHGPRPPQQDGEPSNGALWRFETRLLGSINNSVIFPCMNVGPSPGSGFEPRIAFSNNDCTVKFYDIPLRGELPPKVLKESGILRLDVAVNHCMSLINRCPLICS